MNKIIKTSIMVSLASIFSLTHAEYQAVIGKNTNIRFVQWEETSPIEGPWTNTSVPYGCTNWSPSVDTQDVGVSFTQTATDCKQDQERDVKRRMQDKVSGDIIVKDTVKETRVNTGQTSTQMAVGTKLLKDCRFAKVNANGPIVGNYYVLETGGNTTAYWNGQSMGTINSRIPKYVFIHNGFKYYSTQLMVTDWYYYHNICKEAL